MIAALSAQEVNHNQLGRDLGVDRKTAKAWSEILMSTYQWREIPAYSQNAIKRIAGKPKGYFSDTGFACHLQRITGPDALMSHPLFGFLFETFVYWEITKRIAGWSVQPNIYHFRAYSGAEVDIVLELDGTLYPIEIKAKSHPTSRDVRGIQAMKSHFPNAKFGNGIVISACDSVTWIKEGILCVPWWEI